jgi:catechol 2,3-dioxygenase
MDTLRKDKTHVQTDTIVHPRLQHVALATSSIDTMLDWYRKVLGMTVNNRRPGPVPGREREHHGPPFAVAWISNDEVHQRIALFEIPGVTIDTEKRSHVHLHHFAFQYETLDDLLGTYLRLKDLGITPIRCIDEVVQISFYYNDPEQNSVELNVSNYGNEWTASEHMKNATNDTHRSMMIDPDKLVAARESGASPWELHQRALAGDFTPAQTGWKP